MKLGTVIRLELLMDKEIAYVQLDAPVKIMSDTLAVVNEQGFKLGDKITISLDRLLSRE